MPILVVSLETNIAHLLEFKNVETGIDCTLPFILEHTTDITLFRPENKYSAQYTGRLMAPDDIVIYLKKKMRTKTLIDLNLFMLKNLFYNKGLGELYDDIITSVNEKVSQADWDEKVNVCNEAILNIKKKYKNELSLLM